VTALQSTQEETSYTLTLPRLMVKLPARDCKRASARALIIRHMMPEHIRLARRARLIAFVPLDLDWIRVKTEIKHGGLTSTEWSDPLSI
jgi:hypothetical protein